MEFYLHSKKMTEGLSEIFSELSGFLFEYIPFEKIDKSYDWIKSNTIYGEKTPKISLSK